MLACYLVKENNLTSTQAIEEIRRQRPHSVETYGQEQLVHEYEQFIKESRDE